MLQMIVFDKLPLGYTYSTSYFQTIKDQDSWPLFFAARWRAVALAL